MTIAAFFGKETDRERERRKGVIEASIFIDTLEILHVIRKVCDLLL